MKISISTFATSFILLIVCCFGCKRTESNHITTNEVTFDSVKVEQIYHLLNDTTQPFCDIKINLIYPSGYTDKTVLKSLQSVFISKCFGESYIDKTPFDAMMAYKDQYIADYKQFVEEAQQELADYSFNKEDLGSSFNFYESSYSTILFNKGGVLCFSVFFENYTGGAHGSSRLYGTSIDLSTGAVITEDDLFREDSKDKISEAILQKITEQNNLKDPGELENIGYTDITQITVNGNFLIGETGITYIFNEYEIAPYVMGRTSVLLPYEDINIYINKQSPVAKFAF